jgi:carbamoyl-phosphate synthase small subunit
MPATAAATGRLVLEDGTVMEGTLFGAPVSMGGEVVFNTGMVGYPEAITDPSYYGQILTFTFPLIGNYGVPGENAPQPSLESAGVQVRGVIVCNESDEFSHWAAESSLSDWLAKAGVPGLAGVDTRALTRRLRERGAMLGRIEAAGQPCEPYDPNNHPVVPDVATKAPYSVGTGDKRVLVLDCGCKRSILDNLTRRGVSAHVVPWDHDLSVEDYDGLLISSGPGDPKMCAQSIRQVRQALRRETPVFGICLGHQLMALAIGADTYKLKYGHRSQNQPVRDLETGRCMITSQNHGFAVDTASLRDGWKSWFENLNDGTNEGIRHESGRAFSVQFHPEASPGPVDTKHLFDEFVGLVKAG